MTLALSLSGLRRIVLAALAHPAFPADAVLLTAEELERTAKELRHLARAHSTTDHAAALAALRTAEDVRRLADRARAAARFVPDAALREHAP